MDGLRYIQALLSNDPLRLSALAEVARCDLPDGWIGAGFIRDAVWNDRHGYGVRPPLGDVDVVFFDDIDTSEVRDRSIEDALRAKLPGLAWSVKNQARMHRRNDDAPYTGVADAMRHWPETATAVAARLSPTGTVEIAAPFGTTDLTSLRLSPTPAFAESKLPIFDQRLASKRWTERYPLLTVVRTAVRSLADPSPAR